MNEDPVELELMDEDRLPLGLSCLIACLLGGAMWAFVIWLLWRAMR